jgi:hypothetical protein
LFAGTAMWIRVKQQDGIEYSNTEGNSSRCSRVLIALLPLYMTVSKVLCFCDMLLRCVTPGGPKVIKFLNSFLRILSLVTQAHGLFCGVYVKIC